MFIISLSTLLNMPQLIYACSSDVDLWVLLVLEIRTLLAYTYPIQTCTYIHTHIHTCMHTYIHTYIRTYIHAYIHIYIHIHTYIHTYIRTHTHKQTISPQVVNATHLRTQFSVMWLSTSEFTVSGKPRSVLSVQRLHCVGFHVRAPKHSMRI